MKNDNDGDYEDGDDEYVDPRVSRLERKLADLEQLARKYEASSQRATAQEKQKQLEKQLKAVDSDLLNEGYPGFELAALKVYQKVEAMSIEEPFKNWNTPDGWKKIYKEYVYPEIAPLFIKKSEEKDREDKKQKKKNAQLAGDSKRLSDGMKDDSEEEYTYTDYIKDRRKLQL